MRRLWILLLLPTLLWAGCAVKNARVEDTALTVGELALQLDSAEQAAFQAGLYSVERHQSIGKVVLRVLVAARTFERAVAAGQDGKLQRGELDAALGDLSKLVSDVPRLTTVVEGLRAFLNGLGS